MAAGQSTMSRIGSVLRKVPLLLVIALVFLAGYQLSTAVHRGPARPGPTPDAAAVTWTCSMHPQIRLPAPGACPICSMDLIPADVPAAHTTRPPRYACSMFCLPPQPNPGKCQICGMDMVEVEQDDGAAGDDAGRTLTLSPAARALAEIQTTSVARQFVTAHIRMVGKVDYDETRMRYITAWVPGRLERLYVDYTGIPVTRGDHMVTLYSPELATAQTELLQALDRTRETGRDGIVGQRARDWLEDIRDKFRLWGLTDEQIGEIEQRGTASDTMTIHAPMGGIVIHKNAVEGMYVTTGTRIYTIADLSRVWIKLDAFESDLQWLRYGQEVEFESEAYPGETFIGRIAFIDPVLDARTRTVSVRVNVENLDGRLKPQMFVRAIVHSKVAAGGRVIDAELAGKWISPMHPEIVKDGPGTCDVCGMPLVRAESLGFVSVETGDAKPPLVVPASAALITGKRAVVYLAVPGSPGTFEGREIVLGPRAGDFYIVLADLAEGDAVVTHGNFKIDSAMQILARPSMMNPDPGGRLPADPPDRSTASPARDGLPAPRSDVTGALAAVEIAPAFNDQLTRVVAAYLDGQVALSRDDLATARAAFENLSTRLDDVDADLLVGAARDVWSTEHAALRTTAREAAGAATIERARLSFALLSESLIAVAKRFGGGSSGLHQVHCPMAFDGRGADWLQAERQVANPFFGAAMLRCGTVRETISPHTATPGESP